MFSGLVLKTESVNAHGDTWDKATTKSINTTVDGPVNWKGDHDWFKFKTSSGGAYNIYTTGSTDTYEHLGEQKRKWKWNWHHSGWEYYYNELDTNDDGGQGLNFRFEKNLSADKDYWVNVRGFADQRTGYYQLKFEQNLDSVYNSAGGKWTPDKSKGNPDGDIGSIISKTYIPKEDVIPFAYSLVMLQINKDSTVEEVLGMSMQVVKVRQKQSIIV